MTAEPASDYAFDPEIAPFAAGFPARPIADIIATQAPRPAATAGADAGVRFTDHDLPVADDREALRLRIYQPELEASARGELPALIQFHAGGFVSGSITAEHARNLRLSRSIPAVVVAVDYALAPEHPYPAALQDAHAALTWLALKASEFGVDPARLALHGRSAGGGLAVSTALLARDHGGPDLAFLYLSAPQLDDRCDSVSMRRFGDTPLWTANSARHSWALYLGSTPLGSTPLGSSSASDPERPGAAGFEGYAVPARVRDLSGLPPTYLAVMDFDPLRDEALAFAQALTAADVRTELHLFPGTFHCSGILVDAEISRRERTEELLVLRRALTPPETLEPPSPEEPTP